MDFQSIVVQLEGYQNLSIRELIFREMVANFLIHREYSSPYPARITIYKDTVVSENWTVPHSMGMITPENVMPYPKNPALNNCFRQMGWVEELGSGIRNMYKYCPIYVNGAFPVMEENDVFRLKIRYEKENKLDNTDIIDKVKSIKHADRILELIRENPKITAHLMALELSLSERHLRKILARLVDLNLIERKGADKDGEWTAL